MAGPKADKKNDGSKKDKKKKKKGALSSAGAHLVNRKKASLEEVKKANTAMHDLDSIDVARRLKGADELAELSEDAVEPHFPLLARKLYDENMAVRLRVARTFGRFPDAAEPHAEALAERLAYGDLTVQWRAGCMLAQMEELGAETLARRLDHPSEEVRLVCLEFLGQMGEGAGCVAQWVTEKLADESKKVRISANRCLGRIGPPAGPFVPILAQELKNPDPLPRETCAVSMGKIGEASGPYAEGLARQLHPGQYFGERHQDGRPAYGDVLKVRTTANASLKLMAAEGAAAVSRLLDHPDSRVRVTASQTLGQMGEVAAPYCNDIVQHLTDPDPLARARAAETLGLLGKDAMPHCTSLATLLWDSDSGVRRAAGEALELIGEKQDLYYDDPRIQQSIHEAEAHARKAWGSGSTLFVAPSEANAVMKWWHPVQ